jgi:hypothetical protein
MVRISLLHAEQPEFEHMQIGRYPAHRFWHLNVLTIQHGSPRGRP